MHAVLAVNGWAIFIVILINLRVLELHCHASAIELLDQTLAYYPLTLVEFCLGQQPLLNEEFNQGIGKSRDFERPACVGVGAVVRIEQTANQLTPQFFNKRCSI